MTELSPHSIDSQKTYVCLKFVLIRNKDFERIESYDI